MANCRHCNVELNESNWNPSWRKNNGYKMCKPCFNKKYLATNTKGNDKKNLINNPLAMYVNGKYISRKHPLYKPGRYKTFSDAAFDGTYKLESIKEGYVYAITNPAWPEWVKIGVALDSKKRVKGFNTGSPFRDYKVEYVLETINRHTVEIIAHKKAEEISKDHNSEWFKMSVEDAKNILDNIKGA